MHTHLRHSGTWVAVALTGLLWIGMERGAPAQAVPPPPAAAQATSSAPQQEDLPKDFPIEADWRRDVTQSLVRLPLAALLGAVLAFRPKRKGTPTRTPTVVQTQIILAVVGAAIMLVVGASLARAFGIVGAANLIRYRSKIEDPKDAGVMLCCLAVGLASGVGLFALAATSTMFLLATLALLESFEPTSSNAFELKLTMPDDVSSIRPRLERVLERFKIEHALRASSKEELSYDVKVPFDVETDRITDEIQRLNPKDEVSVAWTGKKPKAAA